MFTINVYPYLTKFQLQMHVSGYISIWRWKIISKLGITDIYYNMAVELRRTTQHKIKQNPLQDNIIYYHATLYRSSLIYLATLYKYINWRYIYIP